MATATKNYKVADIEPRRFRAQGDRSRRGRDARPDADPRGVRVRAAAQGRADHRLAAHDRPDRRADRDPDRPRRRGALGQLQHLLDPGPRRRRDRRRRDPRLRLEGRDPGGVLVVHRAGAALARGRRPEHDPRRRRRRDPARPQGRRVREGGRRARPGLGRFGGVPSRARDAAALARGRPAALDRDRRRDQGGDRGDDHRRAPALPAGRDRRPALPGDQRQRLGHQVEVRQPLRLPPLADRRDQPRPPT